MADLRIPYAVADNYLGTKLASMVADWNAAYNSLKQVARMLNAVGAAVDVETALGLPPGLSYGAQLQSMMVNLETSFDGMATYIGQIDKGV